jgi:hypothetical protein
LRGLGVDLRINRYFIYLVPVVLFTFLELALLDRLFEWQLGLLVLVLVGFNVTLLRPWADYDWGDDTVRDFFEKLPPKPLVICAYRYQFHYYFGREGGDDECVREALQLDARKEGFYLFDLNGNHMQIPIAIMARARVELYQKFNRARFYQFAYPQGTNHDEEPNPHHRCLERHRSGDGPGPRGPGPRALPARPPGGKAPGPPARTRN